MSGKYCVGVYDCAGEFREEIRVETFAECVRVAGESRRKYPGKVVQAFNLDEVDDGCDGLTEDERDAIDDALWVRAEVA